MSDRKFFKHASALDRHARVPRSALLLGALLACLFGCADTEEGDFEEQETELGVTTEAISLSQVWPMESADAWTVVTGTANKQSSTIHNEGSRSLQLTASAFVAVKGDGVDKPAAISPLLALDVMIPTQAGPFYFGAVQISLTAPSLGMFSAWVSQRELSVPTGVWQTLSFQIPSNIYSQLLSSSFNDLSVTIGLNPPQGLNQPFRLDNLRFVPVPGCVGVPDGTACDDLISCTTGNTCAAGVCGTESTAPGGVCDPSDDVLGFENFPAWQATVGAAALAPSTTHVQGVRSLQITTPNFMTVSSIKLATLHKVGRTLSLRVQKPTSQPNPSWHGDVTLNMAVPSLGINLSSTRQLTGQPSGSFFELLFDVPAASYQLLATRSYNDLTFSISVNPPNGQSGSYLLDDLHFVPVASCTNVIDKTACDDNSKCTDGDTCQGGSCGATVVCNDANGCTDDSCNPATGCVFSDNTAPCTDGSACTTGDRCSAGVCVSGGPTDCDDNNTCTVDACNPATGCIHADVAGSCSDGNACTGVNTSGADSCSAGSCVAGPAISCDDGSNCTNDACDPATGCVHSSSCATSDVCFNDACCTPNTCLAQLAECGTRADGCGTTLACGTCPAGGSCNPAGRCLRPNNFHEPSGINVCERLIESIVIPPTFEEFFTCNDDACGFFHLDCCVPGLCLADPFCTILSRRLITPEQIFNAGDVYCSVTLTPEQYLERLVNGRLDDLASLGTFLTTGGLSQLIEFDEQVMAQAGRQAPSHVRNLIRDLTAPVYDGGATGFSYADMDDVKIVSSSFPTAGFYLPGDRAAITLGPVIVMKSDIYDALFAGANSGVSYAAFLTSTSVSRDYIEAVDTLIHELVHVKQYRELGKANFTVQYLGQALANGYGEISFEEEAFVYEIELTELQGGRWCGVMANTDNDFISTFSLPVAPNTCPPL